METTAIVIAQDLQGEIISALNCYNSAMVVADAESAQTASNMANAIAVVEKKIKAAFKQPKEEAYAAHKAITAQEKQLLTPLEAAEKDLKNKIGAWQYKVEMERKRAEEEARRKAAEEAQRKLQEAYRLEEERKAAEAAGKAEEAERLAAEAEAAVDEADAIDTAADTITVAAAPKPTGMSFVTDYRIDSIDLAAMPTTIHGTPIVKADESAILRLIKATKGQIVIPGVKYSEFSRAVRRG